MKSERVLMVIMTSIIIFITKQRLDRDGSP